MVKAQQSKEVNGIESFKIEEINTDQILVLSGGKQDRLKDQLKRIYNQAFPKMASDQRYSHVLDYFRKPSEGYIRQAIFYKNNRGDLIATAIFLHCQVQSDNIFHKVIYIMTRAILPEYRGFGLGKAIALKILTDYKPDILFTTCAQSNSLHSWLNLSLHGHVNHFDVYPQLQETDTGLSLKSVPKEDIDAIYHAFEHAFFEVSFENRQIVKEAVQNLSPFLVRKNIYSGMYDFDPWAINGREDRLAKHLGLTRKDGVLVVFHHRK